MPRALPTAAALLTLLVTAPAAAAACPGADGRPAEIGARAAAKAAFCLVNVERRSHGLRALRSNARLRRSASGYARQMVRQGFFAHESPGGSTPASRLRAAGYMRGASAWMIGENLGWGSLEMATPRERVEGWMNSPPHRKVILTRRFTELGIGVAKGAQVAAGVRVVRGSGPLALLPATRTSATYAGSFGWRARR